MNRNKKAIKFASVHKFGKSQKRKRTVNKYNGEIALNVCIEVQAVKHESTTKVAKDRAKQQIRVRKIQLFRSRTNIPQQRDANCLNFTCLNN